MRVFLSEYLTCGAYAGGEENAPLAREGAAMLRSLAEDAAAVPDWRVTVTWGASLASLDVSDIEVFSVGTPDDEIAHFRRLAAEADATLVIAPEFGGLLEERRRVVEEVGGHFVGSTAAAIRLCADKLALTEHLAERGVPTIPTQQCVFADLAEGLMAAEGLIVKPRYGAGSVEVYRVRNSDERSVAEAAYQGDRPFGNPIVQPYLRGVPLSVAAVVSPDGVEVFPVGSQRIIDNGGLHYEGGRLPAATGCEGSVMELARRTIAAVPGLQGYVGIDVVLPGGNGAFGPPVVVEINPRLTTSYLGYRRLTQENLAERVIDPSRKRSQVRWRAGRVEFRADGTACFEPAVERSGGKDLVL